MAQSSRDSTPDVSPPHPGLAAVGDILAVMDQEEGEISNDNLSEISDEDTLEEGELPSLSSPLSEKSLYDVRRYYRDTSSDSRQLDSLVAPSGSGTVDSPASPEDAAVTGSPLKIIPASPTGPSTEPVSDEDDDIDEDLLYLRLIALRSMAAEEEKEKAKLEMTEEMHELIEEADEAAGLQLSDTGTDAALSTMKENLHKSFQSFSSTEEKLDTPVAVKLEPEPEVSEGLEIIDLVSPVPSPEHIPLPGLPPLPPPPLLPSPTSLPLPPPPEPETPADSVLNVAQNYSGYFTENSFSFDPPPPPPPPVISGSLSVPNKALSPSKRTFSPLPTPIPAIRFELREPPPPGEDSLTPATLNQQPGNIVSTDQDAESKFFRCQESSPLPIAFPPSVWSFRESEPETKNCFQTSYEYAPPVSLEKPAGKLSAKRKRRRSKRKPLPTKKRKASEETQAENSSNAASEVKPDDEDEDALRALLLAQVNKIKDGGGEAAVDVPKAGPNKVTDPAPMQMSESCGNVEIKTNSIDKVPRNVPATSAKRSGQTLTAVTSKGKPGIFKKAQEVDHKHAGRPKIPTKPVRVQAKTSAGIKKTMTEEEKKRHFPNLSKKIVIPLNYTSDSEQEEEQVHVAPKPPQQRFNKPDLVNPKTDSFQMNLDFFLREVRQKTSAPKDKSSTLSSTARKNVSMQLKAKAQLLSKADKEKLARSSITNLPLVKQLEYKKLKELIARKEMMKAKGSKVRKPDGTEPLPPAPSKSSSAAPKKVPNLQNTTVATTAAKNAKPVSTVMNNSTKASSVKPAAKNEARTASLANGVDKSGEQLNSPAEEPAHNVAPDDKQAADVDDEDEEALRQTLLRDLRLKTSAKSSEGGGDKSLSISTKQSLTVRISGNRRNVSVPKTVRTSQPIVKKDAGQKAKNGYKSNNGAPRTKDKPPPPPVKPALQPLPGVNNDDVKMLSEKEKGIISDRKDLSGVLYKLSAQMSQLQKQSIELEGAENYAAELRKQLKETDQLVSLRTEKVENLRQVIRNSHQEVTVYKERMLSKEKECIVLGGAVYGPEYSIPLQGAQNIRKKLEQIKSTAQKVKIKKEEPSSAATGGCAVQEESGSLKTKAINTGPGLVCSGLDYVSPLEHVRAEREPAKVFDPDTMLCRFELGGKCVDSACIYQHVAPK